MPYHSTMPSSKFPLLHLGTSSFTAKGWEKAFYPPQTQPRDFLSYYATQFDALEVDATFYRTPAMSTVKNWYAKTPANFRFALKTPQEITHERVLLEADSPMNEFLRATEPLGEKLAVILLQLPYFNKNAFAGPNEFLNRLKPFLEKLPAQPRFALEIRNRHWLVPAFFDLLRKHHIAFALIDHPWMPRPLEYLAETDPVTADFSYVRWLGDRKAIEERTQVWDKTIVDRSGDLQKWVDACRNFIKRKIRLFAFANNHYGGYAPETLRLFEELLEERCRDLAEQGAEEQPKRTVEAPATHRARERTLFD
ncbi:MAG: DUF72 domain-containing protein [Candidatus Acidiferrum sp.]